MSDALAMFDRAAGAAVCNILNSGGNAVLLNGIVAGAMVPGGQLPALAAGLGLMAINMGCAFDPDNGIPPQGTWCTGRTEATGQFITRNDGEHRNFTLYGVTVATVTDDQAGGRWYYTFEGWNSPDPDAIWTVHDGFYWKSEVSAVRYGPAFTDQPSCTLPDPVPVQPSTYTYVDQSTSCSLDVDFLGWGLLEDGAATPVLKISPTPAPQLRSSGGIIQGCNFQPVVYVGGPGGGGDGGGGGGGYTYPWVDGPDDPPWWLPYVEGALGGVVGAAVKALLDKLLEEQVAGKVYRLTSVCETNAAGEPVDLVREVDIPSLSILQGVIYRLDALEYLLQGLKDFRQPTCMGSSATGQLVSVDFMSDEPSPGGTRPLRKLLRYRDQTDSPLPDHVSHWESFVWQAGPVIVKHINGPWGQVQVWASDADEAKRVIRHAGIIAGVDPDAVGEWRVTSSRDPRYGQPGTMRIATRKSWGGQILQISKRPGPDGLPIVPCDCG